ncbi:hypothetical protein [Jannaschia formosa]|uniref:hypothetical protein n=1 Tax=Jannaschia formosa TaxID=2259592 RepID=UPI000E1C2E8E|nr:hypothetical protein [Jannaschia formosa]TFL16441.1 hypothetical protein DR046_20180 [Jannaschia formosa]
MSAVIGALRGVLSLDSAAFERGARRAQASMSGLQRNLDRAGRQMQATGARLSAAVTAPLAAASAALVTSATRAAVETERLAALSNASTRSFQRFAAGAKTAGLESDKVADILKDVNDRVGDFIATGGGPMADFFENIAPKVGVTAEQFAKLSGPDALQLYVSSLEKAGVTQQEMTFYLEAMASDATALLPLLRNNGEEMGRVGDQAERLGAVMSEDTIVALNGVQDSVRRVTASGTALRNQLAAALAPTLLEISERVADVTEWFTQLSPEAKRFAGIAAAVTAALGPALVTLGLMASGLAALSAPFVLVAVAGATAAVLIARHWNSLSQTMPDGTSRIQAAMAGLRAFASDFSSSFVTAVAPMRGLLDQAWEGIAGTFENIGSAMAAIAAVFTGEDAEAIDFGFKSFGDFLGTMAGHISTGIAAGLNSIAQSLEWITASIGAILRGDLPAARAAWDEFVRDVLGPITLPDWIANGIDFSAVLASVERMADDARAAVADWVRDMLFEGTRIPANIAAGIAAGVGEVVGALVGIKDAITSTWAGFSGDWRSLGQNVAIGLDAGIRDEGGTIASTVNNLGLDAIRTIRDALGIRSPSREFMEIGGYLTEGLAVGIADGTNDVLRQIEDLAGRANALGGNLFAQIGQNIGNAIAGGLTGGNVLAGIKSAIVQPLQASLGNAIGGALSGAFSAQTFTMGQLAGTAQAALGGGAALLPATGLFSGIGSGLSSVLSGFGTGGFAGGFGAIGSALSGATTGLAGLGTAIGAAIPVIGAVGLLFSAFKSKTKLLDAGLRVTIDGMDSLVETFKYVEKSRFFGLSKSRKTSFAAAGEDTAAPIQAAVDRVLTGIGSAADALGLMSGRLDEFAHELKISTKDLSDEQIQRAIEDALRGMGDAATGLIVGSYTEKKLVSEGRAATWEYNPDRNDFYTTPAVEPVYETITHLNETFERLVREGESSSEALQRLAASLGAVNGVADTLDHAMLAASLRGGELASIIVDAAGGLDAFGNASAAYFAAFYTDQERLDVAVRQLGARFAEIGVAMPKTRDQFRAIIESLDTTTDHGAKTYGQLIALAGAFAEVTPAVAEMSRQLAGLLGGVGSELDTLLGQTTAAMQANRTAAVAWYRTAETLRDMIADMRGTAGALVSGAQARAFADARFQTLVASAMAGDAAAATDLPKAARALLDAGRATAKTAVEQARLEARVLNDLQGAAGVADLEGARHDVLAGLLGQQVDLLGQVREAILSGEGLTAAQLTAFEASLGSLAGAIEAVESINYADIAARLDVVLEATDNMPPWLSKALGNAAAGITADVEFLVRAENLTPDLRWIALNAASEHLKTVEFLADNRMGREVTRLALATSSDLSRTVRAVIASGIDVDAKRLALTAGSELTRSVRAVLQRDRSDRDALKLALAGIGTYSVAVRATLNPDGIDKEGKRFLRQLEATGTVTRGIRGFLAAQNISPFDKEWLGQIARGDGSASRTIKAFLDSSGIGKEARTFLRALTGADTTGKITLDGGFRFDPSTGFQTWYEATAREQFAAPSDRLRAGLDALRDAVLAETADRKAAEARQAAIAKAQGALGEAAAKSDRITTRAQRVIADIEALEKATGVTLKKHGRDAVMNVGADGSIAYEATEVEYGSGADITKFSNVFWGRGGLEDQLVGMLRQPGNIADRMEALRARIIDLGGVPAFATGGLHMGGLRLVGERGPELEATGPSRIYSAAQTRAMMGGGDDVAREIRSLRDEVSRMREEQRQLGMQTAASTKRTADSLRKFDIDGLPAERV